MFTGVLLAALVVSQPAAAPKAAIFIFNDSDDPWSIWFYVETSKGWSRPPLFLAKKAKAKLNLALPGRYYLVLRDDAKRDQHIGWRDLHELAEKLPGDKTIELRSVVETRTKVEKYTVSVPVQETRTITEIVGGVTRTREIVVTVLRPEARSREITYTAKIPILTVTVDGERLALDDLLGESAPAPAHPGP